MYDLHSDLYEYGTVKSGFQPYTCNASNAQFYTSIMHAKYAYAMHAMQATQGSKLGL